MTTPATPIDYLYVVVRQDVPPPHLTVQVAHAVLAATNAYGDPRRTHPHLVVLTLPCEQDLAAFFNLLKDSGVPCIAWYEEDMKGELTAIASGLISGKQRRHFRDLKLLGA